MERCQSGRMGYPGKVVYPKGYRGFESLSLRHGSTIYAEIYFMTRMHKFSSKKIINILTIIVSVLSLLFVITDHFHYWDKWRGITLLEETSDNFDLSYARDASTPVFPNDPHWKPLLKLIAKYSRVKLYEDRQPKV